MPYFYEVQFAARTGGGGSVSPASIESYVGSIHHLEENTPCLHQLRTSDNYLVSLMVSEIELPANVVDGSIVKLITSDQAKTLIRSWNDRVIAKSVDTEGNITAMTADEETEYLTSLPVSNLCSYYGG